MSELRDRMVRDMTVRGLPRSTHTAYLRAMVGLATHYRRSPADVTNDEVQDYLAHLVQHRKLSWSTASQAANAFRFLYHDRLIRHARRTTDKALFVIRRCGHDKPTGPCSAKRDTPIGR